MHVTNATTFGRALIADTPTTVWGVSKRSTNVSLPVIHIFAFSFVIFSFQIVHCLVEYVGHEFVIIMR